MLRVIGWFCLAVFLASLAVHAASYALVVLLPLEGGAGFLHLAVLLVFFLALVATAAAVRRVRREQGCSQEQAQQAVLARVPRPAFALAVVVFLYAWVVGAWLFLCVEGGVPRQTKDGGFVLMNHGRERPLSEEEYTRLQAYKLRAMSALWVTFSLWGGLLVRSLSQGRGRTDRNPLGPPPIQSPQTTGAAPLSSPSSTSVWAGPGGRGSR